MRLPVLLLALLAVAGYYRSSSRVYRSEIYAQDVTSENLERASELEPDNAEFRYRIGRYSLLMQDFSSAIREFKSAIELNRYDARYWLDLGSAYLASGDSQNQQQALARALEADSTTPEVIWQAANYELVAGNTDAAMRHFRTLLEHDPQLLISVVNVCWRATRDPVVIVDKVLPRDPHSHFALIGFLLSKHQMRAAAQAWSKLIALKSSFPAYEAFPYIDYLFAMGEFAQAGEAWRQLVRSNPQVQAYDSGDNLIVNGSFELDPLNGGLDWRYAPKAASTLVIDVNRSHSGNRSLGAVLHGAPDDIGVYQLLPVRAHTHYRFSGFMMAEELETANAPRFVIRGLKSNQDYVVTEGVQDSTAWQELGGEFTTGPEDDLLLVRVGRIPSLIKGRIWVDDLSLVEAKDQ